MLSFEERSLFLEALQRRRILLDLLQEVIKRGGASKCDTSIRCGGALLAKWEKEKEYSEWCNWIASDVSMSPEEKRNIIEAEVRRVNHSNGAFLRDFAALTPLFLLATSLSRLQYGQFSAEHELSLLDLAMVYAAQGAIDRANAIVETISPDALINTEIASFYGELNLFLILSKGRGPDSSLFIESKHFLPLWLRASPGDKSAKGVEHRLCECEAVDIPPSIMFYCYLAVATVAFALLNRFKNEVQRNLITKKITMKTSLAKTREELYKLKEDVRGGIKQKIAFEVKREEANKLIEMVLHRCENFLKGGKCVDFGAVWAFAFMKLRWERECGVALSSCFIEGFSSCCRSFGLDPVLSTISLAEADQASKCSKVFHSYECDLSGVELPPVEHNAALPSLLQGLGHQ